MPYSAWDPRYPETRSHLSATRMTPSLAPCPRLAWTSWTTGKQTIDGCVFIAVANLQTFVFSYTLFVTVFTLVLQTS